MSEQLKNKYSAGAFVYFVGLDNRCQWCVFGTTVKAVHRINGLWTYDLNTQPYTVRKVEPLLYREYAPAKAIADVLAANEKISPKGAGAPPVNTTKRETLRPVDLRKLC